MTPVSAFVFIYEYSAPARLCLQLCVRLSHLLNLHMVETPACRVWSRIMHAWLWRLQGKSVLLAITDGHSKVMQQCLAQPSQTASLVMQLIRGIMDLGVANNFTVMRMWGSTAGGATDLQTGPSTYNEALFAGLDYVLDQARQRNLKVRWLRELTGCSDFPSCMAAAVIGMP